MAETAASPGFGLEESGSIGAELHIVQTANVSWARAALGAFVQRISDRTSRMHERLYEPGRESDPGRAWAMARAEDGFRDMDPVGAAYLDRAESVRAKLSMFVRTFVSVQANRELMAEWDARARREEVLSVAANKYDNPGSEMLK